MLTIENIKEQLHQQLLLCRRLDRKITKRDKEIRLINVQPERKRSINSDNDKLMNKLRSERAIWVERNVALGRWLKAESVVSHW